MTDKERQSRAISMIQRHNLILANGETYSGFTLEELERLAALLGTFGTPPDTSQPDPLRGTFTLRIDTGMSDTMRTVDDLADALELQVNFVRQYLPLIGSTAWIIRARHSGAPCGAWSFSAPAATRA
jgi:hypothetical protein